MDSLLLIFMKLVIKNNKKHIKVKNSV